MESETIRCALYALSDPMSLRIVKLISQHTSADSSKKFLTEDELCDLIATSNTKFLSLTHKLFELEAAGLITIGRRNNARTCSLRPFMFKALSRELNEIAKPSK